MGTVSNATPLDDQAILEICLMYRNGRKLRDIRNAFHISYNRLEGILMELGVERKVKPSRGTTLPADVPADTPAFWDFPEILPRELQENERANNIK